eukprot:5103341-Pyramimonas_sp.AAC.1
MVALQAGAPASAHLNGGRCKANMRRRRNDVSTGDTPQRCLYQRTFDILTYTITSFYESSCANDGKGALNTPDLYQPI